MYDSILAFFDWTSFNQFVVNNAIVVLSFVVLVAIMLKFFSPWFKLMAHRIRMRRLRWSYQLMVGKKMSKRQTDHEVAEEVYSMLLEMRRKNKITDKQKRKYLRMLEIVFELEPGLLMPRPSLHEIKRRIRGRLSAEAANLTSLPPVRRLAAMMSKKG